MLDRSLWGAAEIVEATAGVLHGSISKPLNGVAIDSRSISNGDIFVAIKGDNNDGHDYVVNALNAGAGVAIVSRPTEAMFAAGPVIVIGDDPLRGLERMAIAARKRSAAQIVAITGSVGKTSTKEMLRTALEVSGQTHASAASFNNHWGVPLTLSRFHPHSAYGVFEIGMNHHGEITPLVGFVKPHVAIVTNVAASHLGYFNSLSDIAIAKSEIFSGLVAGGAAVINRDSDYFDQLAEAAKRAGVKNIFGFGKHRDAQIHMSQVALHPTCCCVTADVMGETLTYKLGVPGEHMALNSLAVLAAVKLMGADLARAALALAHAEPAKGRGQQQKLKASDGEITLIDESYNANPASVEAALALLAQIKPSKRGRRIAVLGDMLELGDFGPQLHAEISVSLDNHNIDQLYASGPLMAHLWNQTPLSKRGAYAGTAADLTPLVLADLRGGDVVMIKGSNGSKMGLLAESLRKAFPPITKDVS